VKEMTCDRGSEMYVEKECKKKGVVENHDYPRQVSILCPPACNAITILRSDHPEWKVERKKTMF
jgi:hypothetical protein